MHKPHESFSDGRLPAVCLLVKMYVDIYLQAEEAPVVSCRDPGRRLEPLARLPQQVAQRPDGGDCDGAGAAGQDQHAVAPPAHVHQRVVLLLIWDGSGGGRMKQHGDTECNISGRRHRILASESSDHVAIRHYIRTTIIRQLQLLADPRLQGHGQLTLTDGEAKG